MAVLGVLALAGVAALVVLAQDGSAPLVAWAYPAATLSFLLSTVQAAPILALATRLTRGHWAAPLRRLAEVGAVAGLVTAPLSILLLWQLPEWRGRPSIWFDWPGAPLVWDSAAIVILAVVGLALLHVAALPDFAAARDAGAGRLASLRTLGWRGTLRQWSTLEMGLTLLGICYFMAYVLVQLVVVSDLALSLVPHWNSAVMPPFQVVSGFQGGVAATVLALAAVRVYERRHRGADDEADAARDPGDRRGRVGDLVFHSTSQILLAVALIWSWFVWSELVTYWYGRMPHEQWLLALLMFGPSLGPFLAATALCFVLPLAILIWSPVRQSVTGPVVVSALVLVGVLADRVRTFGMAWAVAGPVRPSEAPLPPLPPFPLPGLLDVLVLAGMPAAVLLLGLIVLRWLPPLPLWELRAMDLVTESEPLPRTPVTIAGKAN